MRVSEAIDYLSKLDQDHDMAFVWWDTDDFCFAEDTDLQEKERLLGLALDGVSISEITAELQDNIDELQAA
jgi:hypothetical protein